MFVADKAVQGAASKVSRVIDDDECKMIEAATVSSHPTPVFHFNPSRPVADPWGELEDDSSRLLEQIRHGSLNEECSIPEVIRYLRQSSSELIGSLKMLMTIFCNFFFFVNKFWCLWHNSKMVL